MKRKLLVTLAIILGVLLLAVILIWPAAPLWVRLGAEPFCISGSWPDLKLGPCTSDPDLVTYTPRALPTAGPDGPVPVIFDDDGSPDGTIALMYFLSNPLFDVRAVTISQGEAHPGLFAGHVQRLLAGLGRADIPVGAGGETPLEGNNVFPEPWRQLSDDFWGITYPQAPVTAEVQPAADLIVEVVNASDRPVMIFVSGTHTNLAGALQLDPGITANIRDVQVMGGSIEVPGNIHSDWPEIDNTVAEWNIWADPVAARQVLTSGLPVHLVPLDATRQVTWTAAQARRWTASGSPEGALAGQLLQWMLDNWSPSGVYVWDLVAAVSATDPTLCPQVPLALDVLVAPGPEQGRLVGIDGSPNVVACLDPYAAQIIGMAATVFAAGP